MMRSLRSRLIIGMLLGLATLLVAADTAIYMVQKHQLYRAFDETLASSANSLALLFHHGPWGPEFDITRAASLPAGQLRHDALFQFWSDQPIHLPPSRQTRTSAPWEEGTARSSPPPLPPDLLPFDWDNPYDLPPSLPDEWEPRGRRNTGRDTLVVRSTTLGEADLPRLETAPGKLSFARILLPDGTPGRAVGLRFQSPASMGPGPPRRIPAELTAVVAASTAAMERELHFLVLLLAVTAIGTMAVSAGVAWLVVTRGLNPLSTVAHRIAAMDELGLKERIAARDVPREIEPVVNQLNGLLGRLDEAFERERALTADVAHELRTPVAEISTIAEITLSRSRGEDEYRQALGDTLESARSLQGLIEKLLTLARLESGHIKAELDLIAMKPVLARQWSLVSGTAEQRRIVFDDRCPPDLMVTADPQLLEVVLSNALYNAVAYTPDDGRITVVGENGNSGCTFRIINTGCTLQKNDLARVFDRFWRGDSARTKRTNLSCGLGLPLVRRAMEAVGGKADTDVNADSCFVLTLTFGVEAGNE